MPQPQRLELDFAPDSRVGRLWADVQQHYLKEYCPSPSEPKECLGKLQAEAHTGYNSIDFTIRKRIYDPAKLLSGEVAEYAYRFSEHYPYLAKHGFPLPFVMDDFDPTTPDDEEVQKEVFAAVDGIKAKLVQDGLKPETPEYQMALIKDIYEWGVKTLSFEEDCELEATAVEAFKNKCGLCTETSAIMFAAYQHAGLNPQFVDVLGDEPTPSEFVRELNKPAKERNNGHVCIGIQVPGREGLLLIDVINKKFDPLYNDTFRYSLQEYVQDASLSNRFNDLERAKLYNEGRELAELGMGLSPEDFSWHMNLYNAQAELGNKFEVSRLAEVIGRKFADNPIAIPLFTICQMGMGDVTNETKIKRMEDAIKILGDSEPRGASRLADMVGDALANPKEVEGVDRDFKRQTLELAARFYAIGMEYDERYLANFADYTDACNKLGWWKEAADFSEAYSQKMPDSVLGHYTAAISTLKLVNFTLKAEAGPLLEMAERHIDAMCRLTDCHSESNRSLHMELEFALLFFAGRHEEALKLLEDAYLKSPKELSSFLCGHLLIAYIADGRFSDARGLISKSIELRGDEARNFWAQDILSRKIVVPDESEFGSDGKMIPQPGITIDGHKMVLGILEVLGTAAKAIGQSEKFKDKATTVHLYLAFVANYKGEERLARQFFAKAGTPLPQEAKEVLSNTIGDITEQMHKVTIGKKRLKGYAKFVDDTAAMFKGIADKNIAQLYIQLARHFIIAGDGKGAKKMLQSAIELDAGGTFDAYFNDVIQKFAGAAFEDKTNQPKLEAAVTAMALCTETDPPCPAATLRNIDKGLEWFEMYYKDTGRINTLKRKLAATLE